VAVAFQRGKVMALKWKDKKDVILLSMTDNAEMVDVADDQKKMTKLHTVMDCNNTIEK
jgi:hypothetical protein